MSSIDDQTVALDETQAISGPVADKTQMSVGVDCPVCGTSNPPSEIYCVDCGFMLEQSPGEAVQEAKSEPAKLVSTDGTREIFLRLGENSVGRKDTDVLVYDSSVSRSHAVIEVSEDSAIVKDIGSTNGTKVNNETINANEDVAIADGDEVQFGNVAWRFVRIALTDEPADVDDDVIEGAEAEEFGPTNQDNLADEEPQDRTDEVEKPTPAEEKVYGFLKAKDGSMQFEISCSPCNVGRRGSNDIVLSDPYCSGSHASITFEDGVISISDLGSSNGTIVNGIALEPNVPKVLAEGDEITIGHNVFLYTEVL